jgi:hypothetical protein
MSPLGLGFVEPCGQRLANGIVGSAAKHETQRRIGPVRNRDHRIGHALGVAGDDPAPAHETDLALSSRKRKARQLRVGERISDKKLEGASQTPSSTSAAPTSAPATVEAPTAPEEHAE